MNKSYRQDLAVRIKEDAAQKSLIERVRRAREQKEWATSFDYERPTKLIKKSGGKWSLVVAYAFAATYAEQLIP